MVETIKRSWERASRFLRHDVWDMDISSLSTGRSLPIRLVRVGQLVIKGFKEDDLAVHASALTFVTLMSLVPMLAVAFALLKGFGFGQERIDALLAWTKAMPPEFQAFVGQVLDIVNSTNFAAMGWVGLCFVMFTAVLVLGSVEVSFNRIWGVKMHRGVFRQVANYISILVLLPLLIGIAGTLEASLKGSELLLPASVSCLVRVVLRLASIFTTWLAFLFLYTFLPNTRVRFMPALVSAFFGALVWVSWQKMYITLQLGVARYNAIYGTFASVPIFLAWLYTSWVIVLLGAELTFALQNSSTFTMESTAENANAKAKFMLALSILLRAAQSLVGQEQPFVTSSYAREHRIPIRLLNEMVRVMVQAGLLVETAAKGGCYVLVRAPDALKISDIAGLIARNGTAPESLGLVNLDPAIMHVIESIEQGASGTLAGMTVSDLLKSQTPV